MHAYVSKRGYTVPVVSLPLILYLTGLWEKKNQLEHLMDVNFSRVFAFTSIQFLSIGWTTKLLPGTHTLVLKGSATRFPISGFFHESVSPKPLSILLGSFRFFSRKFAEIFASQGAPRWEQVPPPEPLHLLMIPYRIASKSPGGLSLTLSPLSAWSYSSVVCAVTCLCLFLSRNT